MKKRKYIYNESIFEFIDSHEKAYWIGYLMADGSVSKKHGLRLGLAIKDQDIITKFQTFIGAFTTPIKDEYSKNSHKKVIALYSVRLLKDIEKYGLTSNKTKRTEIKNIPEEFINSFILGYFDGDGCIHLADTKKKTNKCFVSISSSSIKILEQIQAILYDKKILYHKKYIKKIFNKHCWELRFSGKQIVLSFYKYLYSDAKIFLNRKKEKFIELSLRKDKKKLKTSQYIGVYMKRTVGKNPYIAIFNHKYIGSFPSETEAAIAYNNHLISLCYDIDRLNTIQKITKG